jgi:orotidine-5'-phosphate decarboxylase
MKPYAIIAAADLPTSEQVLDLTRKVGSIVDGIKIGVPTVLESGLDTVKRMRDKMEDKPLLLDLKISDIGFRGKQSWDGTNAKIIRALKGSGVTHVTVHGFPGPVSVAEAVEVATEVGIGVLLLPLMSHPAGGVFFSATVDKHVPEFEASAAGVTLADSSAVPIRDVSDAVIHIGESLAVAGYIGPATRPDDLKRYRSLTQRPIWCPGFGRQDRLGRNMTEQFRDWADIVGPESAAIVGSAIFKADDPAAAAAEVARFRDAAIE